MERLRTKDPETLKRLSELEALFAPKRNQDALPPPPRSSAKLVTFKVSLEANPKRDRLLDRLLAAEGPTAVSRAADEFAGAGFPFPADQDVWLKLLDHADEERVREAIVSLGTLFGQRGPKRRALVEARLRRIEQCAEDAATREAASRLLRIVTGKTLAFGQS